MIGLTVLRPAIWLWLAGGGALLLLAWGLWWERERSSVGWRRWALAVSVLCLFLLVVQPAYETTVPVAAAVLVTPRAAAEAVRALAPKGGAYFLAGAAAGVEHGPVLDLALLARRHPELRRWQVAGVGLAPRELVALPGELLFAAPAEPAPGVDRIDWPRRLVLGAELTVRGSLVGMPPAVTVQLLGPGGLAATLDFDGGSTSFALRTRPKLEGRWLYRLRVVSEERTLAEGTIDVEVVARELPSVLWLAGAPSFEARAVKNWLQEVGGKLLLRTRVGRERYRYDTVNGSGGDLDRLTVARLADFDLAVIDGGGWSSTLSRSERAAVREAVAAGLGLLVIPPVADFLGGELAQGLSTVEVGDLERFEIRPRGPGLELLPALVVPARELELDNGSQQLARPLLRDAAGRVLAASRPVGLGTVVVTLLEDSYRWPLRGEADGHRRYWAHLLAAVARHDAAAIGWQLSAGPILAGRALDLSLLSGAPWLLTIEAPLAAAVPLPLEQEVVEPSRWRARYYPRQPGWHRLLAGDQEAWFYVQEELAWLSWQQRRAGQATRQRALADAVGNRAPPAPARSTAPVARGWIFVLLLLSLASLWADEQWRGGSLRLASGERR